MAEPTDHARFFTDFAEFAAYLPNAQSSGRGVDYVTISSPNYLLSAHIEFALRLGADAICENRMYSTPRNWIRSPSWKSRQESASSPFCSFVSTIKAEFAERSGANRIEGHLTYVTDRSQWYYTAWKGDDRKSGGVSTNIGVHFFDVLTYFFGPPLRNTLHHRATDCAVGAVLSI